MIIRLTICDSDVVHEYVNFCIGSYYAESENRCGFTLLDNLFRTCFSDYYDKEINELRYRILGEAHKKWKKSDPYYQVLIDEIYRQWDIYAKDNGLEGWMTPKISIQNSVSEKDENGEVCYYFTATSQCLIM